MKVPFTGMAMATLAILAAPSLAGASEAVWNLLRSGGHIVIMRHTLTTPGAGDPAGFRLEDCATQRNLSDTGREDARRIGAAFRSRGIPVARVLSSPWCRCLETARLAFGRAETWTALNNLHGDRRREPEQMRALREVAGQRPADGNLVLVTHGSVVLPLTGIHPVSGEFLVLAPEPGGRFRVAGRLAPDAVR
ncbi:MAG: histidine phosphatase family protein [Candidatus Rokuibacteriota bacterium]